MTPLVYTMGKVGSTSVLRALERAEVPVFHIHRLELTRLVEKALKSLSEGRLPPGHISTSMAIRDRVLNRRTEYLIVTLVREPVSRNLSAFFENLDDFRKDIRDINDPDSVFAAFLEAYPHDGPLTWFDRELRDQLGVDVYRHPFPKEVRFLYIEDERILIFRDDCPDNVKGSVLSDILRRNITVSRENVGTEKSYSKLYQQVQSRAAYPEALLNRLYNSKYARHFWTDEELDGFRSKFVSATPSNLQWTLPPSIKAKDSVGTRIIRLPDLKAYRDLVLPWFRLRL